MNGGANPIFFDNYRKGGAVCCGLRFQAHLNAVSNAVCGFGTFYVRFAVLDENSSFWSNFWKALLPRVEETTYKNARSMVRKAHPCQTAPTAPPFLGIVSKIMLILGYC